MADRESLISACLARPEDDTARLVLADWLREQSDPGLVAGGRFLWGGVVASRYRDAKVIEDGEYFAAIAELGAVASAGRLSQWLRHLGLPGSWAWDHAADVVTVRDMTGRRRGDRRAVGSAVWYERGMLTRLAVPLSTWVAVAGEVLARCPLSRVDCVDVPGLSYTIRRIDLEGGSIWVMIGELVGPALAAGVPRPRWQWTATFKDRADLAESGDAAAASIVGEVRGASGDRWTGPALVEG